MAEESRRKLLNLVDKMFLYNGKPSICLPYDVKQDIIDLCEGMGIDYYIFPENTVMYNDDIYTMIKESDYQHE